MLKTPEKTPSTINNNTFSPSHTKSIMGPPPLLFNQNNIQEQDNQINLRPPVARRALANN